MASAAQGYTLLYMAKKALPLRIDEDLLARVDERRRELGQTRTLFVERALETALGSTPDAADVMWTPVSGRAWESNVPEPQGGCPECGGDLKPVPDTDYRMCSDCQALSR